VLELAVERDGLGVWLKTSHDIHENPLRPSLGVVTTGSPRRMTEGTLVCLLWPICAYSINFIAN
jgi:hypothetical protein